MGAGISPMGMNMPQQPQGQGKGGGGRSAVNQQLMNMPGFADSLQASQQRMAQDPNANMMRTQPALPAGYDPSIHKPSLGFVPGFEPASGPSTIPSGMQGDAFRAQQMSTDAINPARQAGLQAGHTPGQPPNPYARMSVPQPQQMNEQIRMQQQQQLANASFGPVPDSMRQMPIGGFGQPDQASMQAQINDLARRRADPYAMQMQMQADALQGRRLAPPFQMQPQMNNHMFGGLGALMAMRGFGGGFSQPMGGFGGYGGGFSQPMGGFGGYGGGFGGGFGGYAPPQFGGGFGGKGGGGFSPPQMNSPFGAAMGRGLGGLAGFFR